MCLFLSGLCIKDEYFPIFLLVFCYPREMIRESVHFLSTHASSGVFIEPLDTPGNMKKKNYIAFEELSL